ncbi:metal ABC transporter solute-binding protein, Zn/Mn family [Alkalihalophilus lindianensis]|uniref:metal ABC transporter solute-binding protein, Zn/Mn family n=1 Tax=Alkalihalophilus lindianensis TaxID=1630542 RepID=UPI003F6B5B24
MNVKKVWGSVIVTLFLLITGCGSADEGTEEISEEVLQDDRVLASEPLDVGPLIIYTTVYALEDFTEKIGREFVQVENIIPAGADAHTYEPTIRSMIGIGDGDAFIYNGGGMEGFVETLIDTMSEEELLLVEASEGIEFIGGGPEHDHSHSHDHSEKDGHSHDYDPHVFIDPVRSITLAQNIKDALIELMPEEEELFQANFELLKTDLEAIDQAFRDMVENAAKEKFLVAHAGYTYWAERYGLEQISITGFSPTNEPSYRQLEELMAFANEHEIEYVIFEKNYTIPIAEMFLREVNAEPLYFYNLEALTAEQRREGKDYIKMMSENIKTLETALN